jgi:hypothetical protein
MILQGQPYASILNHQAYSSSYTISSEKTYNRLNLLQFGENWSHQWNTRVHACDNLQNFDIGQAAESW